jgi:chorismate lyase/3-hydroxybenzoate synthase
MPVKQTGGQPDDTQYLLATIHYAGQSGTPQATPGRIDVPVRPLGDSLIEVWRSRYPVERGQREDVFFSHNDDVLAGHLYAAEEDYPNLETSVFESYRRLYTVARAQGYPYLLRIWNFLPDINSYQGDLERYQAFCQGRHRALATLATAPLRLPAASAIGTRACGLQIYFLAAREPGAQVENPRQVSAFHYPRRYSPKSPSFSRAIAKRWGPSTHLYISGTASIVGHETRHSCTVAQLDETLNNLGTLVRHASRLHPLGIQSVNQLSVIKIYVRAAEDGERIAERLAETLGTLPPVLLLHGDICRSDLRLEVEGLYTGTST